MRDALVQLNDLPDEILIYIYLKKCTMMKYFIL